MNYRIYISRIAYRRLKGSKMDAVKNSVLSAIPAVGDIVTFETVLESLPIQDRRFLPDALRDLKRQGKIKKWVEVVNGETLHQIQREAL
jgi:hypothetical protein